MARRHALETGHSDKQEAGRAQYETSLVVQSVRLLQGQIRPPLDLAHHQVQAPVRIWRAVGVLWGCKRALLREYGQRIRLLDMSVPFGVVRRLEDPTAQESAG